MDSVKVKNNLPKELRNNWSIGITVTENGFGFGAGLFKNLDNNYDFYATISVGGLTDRREFEEYDYYGNAIVRDKEKRIILIPLNIGIQRYMFKEDIDGGFLPYITAGITPALVLTNPYDKSYFTAFKYFQAAFAAGGFAGIGMEFIQGQNIALGLSARYMYLTPIGKDINSLKGKNISNLGGFQLNFVVNFLK
jgi:outer membrane protein W